MKNKKCIFCGEENFSGSIFCKSCSGDLYINIEKENNINDIDKEKYYKLALC